jgi:mycofactocin precursor
MAEVQATEQEAQNPAPAEPGAPAEDDALVADELLVEEISIDGMCGVY